jgi:hypothetical protein
MRYVLRYRGKYPPPDYLDQLADNPNVDLVDWAAPGLALVEAAEDGLAELRGLLPNWTVAADSDVALPDLWPRDERRRY